MKDLKIFAKVAHKSKVFRNHCTNLICFHDSTFSAQFIVLFRTYDASQVKDFFENIDTYFWTTDRFIKVMEMSNFFT